MTAPTTPITERQRDLIARAHAADGRIEPFLDIKGGAKIKMIEALAKRGLIEQDAGQWRITQAAVALVVKGEAPADDPAPPTADGQAARRANGKLAKIIAALAAGATIPDLVAITGWQPHSLRAALCHTLPRKGIRILAERQDGMRRKVYRIVEG